MAYSEDHIVLAAEYALGTLDSGERTQVQTMMAVDKDFAAVVDAWELRLSVLNQMVGLIEPRPELWERIKAAISRPASQPVPVEVDPSQQSFAFAASEPAAEIAPSTEQPPVVSTPVSESTSDPSSTEIMALTEPVPPVEQVPQNVLTPAPVPPPLVSQSDHEITISPPPLSEVSPHEAATIKPNEPSSNEPSSNVIALTTKVRQWRTVAAMMTAVAAVMLALLGVQVFRPELVPGLLRMKSPGAASAQYVALLQGDAASPAFILTVDAGSKNFTVRRVGATPEPGKSYELWLVSDTLSKPRSLGVIGGSDFITRPALASYDADTLNRATYAVTLEPEGGSPTGAATGPIVFSGKLIETVPTH